MTVDTPYDPKSPKIRSVSRMSPAPPATMASGWLNEIETPGVAGAAGAVVTTGVVYAGCTGWPGAAWPGRPGVGGGATGGGGGGGGAWLIGWLGCCGGAPPSGSIMA